MKTLEVKIHENDLNRLVKAGILQKRTSEHPSKTMHYGYRTVTYSYRGREIHSYEINFGDGFVAEEVNILASKSLYDKIVRMSNSLIFKPIWWADRYFNET